jgi:hypothetical protein
MDALYLLKSAFSGFALCVGALMLTFFVLGTTLRLSKRHFNRVFLAAGICSFLLADAFLYYKIVAARIENPSIFLLGNVSGWLSGIFFGLTRMKHILAGFLKGS